MTRKDALQGLLLDLEGTLYFKSRPIDGAQAALSALRARGLRLRFLSNTDSSSAANLIAPLKDMGLTVDPSEIFSAASAALQFLKASPHRRCHCLVSRELAAELAPWTADGPASVVIVGDCRDSLTYDALNAAFRHLRAGADLLALQKGRFFVRQDGEYIDTGAFVTALEYASGKQARVLGKPSAEFFQQALAHVQSTPDQALVVGDDVTTDIQGAAAAGIRSVLVRTGKYSDAALAASPTRPDWIIDSIADLPDLLG